MNFRIKDIINNVFYNHFHRESESNENDMQKLLEMVDSNINISNGKYITKKSKGSDQAFLVGHTGEYIGCCGNICKKHRHCTSNCPIQIAIDVLHSYEIKDKIRKIQGNITSFSLPFGVDDTIYVINSETNCISEERVVKITFSSEMGQEDITIATYKGLYSTEDLGETVFLTSEEALKNGGHYPKN